MKRLVAFGLIQAYIFTIYAAEFFCYVGDLIVKEIDNLVKGD